MDNDYKIIGVDLAHTNDMTPKMTTGKVICGVIPKKRCKNKFIQKILIKLFGYETVIKDMKAWRLDIKPEDVPIVGDGNITIET